MSSGNLEDRRRCVSRTATVVSACTHCGQHSARTYDDGERYRDRDVRMRTVAH